MKISTVHRKLSTVHQNLVMFTKKSVQNSDSATSNFFHSVEFLSTGLRFDSMYEVFSSYFHYLAPQCHVDHCSSRGLVHVNNCYGANKNYLPFFILNKLWNYDETWNAMQYCHIHNKQGSYDNLLIWQLYIVIKYHHKYMATPNLLYSYKNDPLQVI
jgi:hypothetical protein